MGGFEDADDAESGFAVAEWSLVGLNAVDEVSDHFLEGFDCWQVWAPDVSGAVADQDTASGFEGFFDGDAAVIDADFLGWVEVIKDDAFFAAADDEVSDFDGAEPIDVEGGEESGTEIEIEVGDILDAV